MIKIIFFLEAWKRNHEQVDGVAGNKRMDASQDLEIEKRYYRKPEQNNKTGKGYEIPSPPNTTSSAKPMMTVLTTKDGLERRDLSTSAGSSFSSIASIKRKPIAANPKDTANPESSPMIPPRAPVLETLKRTKRELVKRQTTRVEEGRGMKVCKDN